MNILITSHFFYPSLGGIETVTELLALYFSNSGHSVRVITQSPTTDYDDKTFPYIVIRNPSLCSLLSNFNWSDVVLQNNLEARQLWPLLIFRRPLVISIHTWIRTSAGVRGLLQYFKLLLLRLADQLIAASDSLREDTAKRAQVVGNPFNDSLFRVLPDVSRSHSIVFLGRLVSDKGVDMLLKAFAGLPTNNWRISLIGDGPERSILEQLANDLGILKYVDFLGSLQGDQLVHQLNQHEILVVPSRWKEPFGVVVLEGLACGCAVLASDGGGLPDAVGPAGLLYRHGDIVDFQSKLWNLMVSSDLREALKAKSEPHLLKFRQNTVCRSYLDILMLASL